MATIRFGQRTWLRAGAGAAGALGVGVLAACGPTAVNAGARSASSAAAPQRGPAPTVIRWAPWGGWPSYGGARWQQFIQPGIAYFESKNPGIKLELVSPGGGGSFLAAILAGSAPDVFQDWAIGPYRAANAVLNLEPYLRRDNIDPSIWSPGQMHAMSDQAGIQFLPCYVHVTTMAVNLSILDQKGLAYPTPDWTYVQAEQLYRACSGVKGKQRTYGASMYFTGHDLGDPSSMSSYVFHFFGGSMAAPDRTTCLVGDPRSYQGVQWVETLHHENVLSPAARNGDLAHIAFVEAGSAGLPSYLMSWRNNFKWTFFPVPHFPGGQFSFEATDYHAINAGTKHPEEAWTLLRFLSAEPYWSRYAMKYLLRTPSLISLWGEYATVVEQVAPLVKGKGLQYFTDAAQHWGIANTIFKYSQQQVGGIINAQLLKVYNGQASVPLAMRGAGQQVDALESAAGRLNIQAAGLAKAFPVQGAKIAAVQPGL